MTRTDLEKLKEMKLELVRENFKRDGELVAACLISYADGGGEIIAAEFQDDRDKKAFAMFLKKYCAMKNPIALMFVSEASMLAIPKSRKSEYLDDNGDLKVTRPQDNDEAIPVIVCSFETKLTSEVIMMKVKSVGGVNLILSEERQGKMTDGLFKDILMQPIGNN